MMRDTGLRRTWLLTGALAAAGVAGTVVVGLAARADSGGAATSETIPSPAPSAGPSGVAWPSLSAGSSAEPGQATSGGS